MAVKTVAYNGMSFPIHYEIVNPQGSGDALFLHGWGSNKEVMKSAFARTMPQRRHIYVDMPGFGKSPNDAVLTTADYAGIMDLFCQAAGIGKTMIFGHSFGGKVGTLMAPAHLVLLSSAGIPAPKPLAVRLKIALFKTLRRLGLGGFWRLFATKDASGMPRNMYETLKNVVDEDFSAVFAAFNGKCDIFWGEEDTATPLFCGEKLASLIAGSRFVPMKGDHYFFLTRGAAVAAALDERQGDR